MMVVSLELVTLARILKICGGNKREEGVRNESESENEIGGVCCFQKGKNYEF